MLELWRNKNKGMNMLELSREIPRIDHRINPTTREEITKLTAPLNSKALITFTSGIGLFIFGVVLGGFLF